jgi:hypothetical protein
MSLPREIRDMIYGAMFKNLPSTFVVHTKLSVNTDSADLPRILPPVCYVNRQIFGESMPMLLRPREIHVGVYGHRVLANFLHRVPNKDAFRAVSSLLFASGLTWELDNDDEESDDEGELSLKVYDACDMVARCTALRHITLEVSSFFFTDLEDDYNPRRKPARPIQKACPVRVVTRCPALQTFKLVCRCGEDYLKRFDLPYSIEEFFEPLVNWMRE